jgi:hypothetical protein
MNNMTWLPQIISNFTPHLPVLVVSLVALIVVFTRWRQGSTGSLWALFGFGLASALCFIIPISQFAMNLWLMQSDGPLARRGFLFGAMAIFWSILRAATYVFLLMAVFAGRPQAEPQ